MNSKIKIIFIIVILGSLFSCGGADDPIFNLPGVDANDPSLGSVQLSGADTAQIGSSFKFVTVVSSLVTTNFLNVAWGGGAVNLGGVVSVHGVDVLFDQTTGAVNTVFVVFSINNNNDRNEDWNYRIDCSVEMPCTNISVDLVARSVSFTSFVIPKDTGDELNRATGALVVNGSLNYKPLGG